MNSITSGIELLLLLLLYILLLDSTHAKRFNFYLNIIQLDDAKEKKVSFPESYIHFVKFVKNRLSF